MSFIVSPEIIKRPSVWSSATLTLRQLKEIVKKVDMITHILRLCSLITLKEWSGQTQPKDGTNLAFNCHLSRKHHLMRLPRLCWKAKNLVTQ